VEHYVILEEAESTKDKIKG